MLKFSIIIPVYNAEKYLKKCLDSILAQTYKNSEMILVNDGSTDNSQKIIDEYIKTNKNIICIEKDNEGPAVARNVGIEAMSGDIIIFVDSDDYIEKDLLEIINHNYNNEDIIGFNFRYVDENNNLGNIIKRKEIKNVCGEKTILELIESKEEFGLLWSYAYKSDFWKQNKFQLLKGKDHEDFELIPKIILKAKNISFMDYVGYYYYQSTNSVTRNNNYQKSVKKAYDVLEHYDSLINISYDIKDAEVKNVFQSYIANAVINKLKMLNKYDKRKYAREIVKRHMVNYLRADNLKRFLKKVYIILHIYTLSFI